MQAGRNTHMHTHTHASIHTLMNAHTLTNAHAHTHTLTPQHWKLRLVLMSSRYCWSSSSSYRPSILPTEQNKYSISPQTLQVHIHLLLYSLQITITKISKYSSPLTACCLNGEGHCLCIYILQKTVAHTTALPSSGCFEPSQPHRITAGLVCSRVHAQ